MAGPNSIRLEASAHSWWKKLVNVVKHLKGVVCMETSSTHAEQADDREASQGLGGQPQLLK